MKKKSKYLILEYLSIIALALAAAPSVHAQDIISLNIKSGTTTGNSWVSGSFGIAAEGTVVGWWTNTSSFGAATPATLLYNSKGVATPVSATIKNAGGQNFWGATYILTPWNYGIAKYVATAGEVSITFDNLNTAFPAGYYVIVYVNGAETCTGAVITDGTDTYYFRPSSPASTTPVLVTDTNPVDGYSVGNYVKFGSAASPRTADSIVITIPSVVFANAGIGGVQIVGIPVPAITSAVINGSNEYVLDFTGGRSKNYQVKKSTNLTTFNALSVPLIESTDANGVGQAVVPASEMSGPKQFFILEDAP